LYSLATVAGILCVPGVLGVIAADADILHIIQGIILLPLISLLIATGMYILNDLIDADLDRANGKKRPIPSGLVSKKQAWLFVISTNGLAIVLTAITLNPATMMIVLPMLAIGIMYSAPKVALMNRFVIKTLSISIFYAICALLGITSTFGIDLAFANPVVPIYSMALLGIMIFISSTLNDLGDIDGDRAARRKTIPVVLGAKRTIKLLSLMAFSMSSLWIFAYEFVGPISVVLAISFSLLVIVRLRGIGHGIEEMDVEAIRHNHKRIFPMHMVLQLFIVVGALLLPY
jgi:4-hydroxybenzoate polyprenyltransferase